MFAAPPVSVSAPGADPYRGDLAVDFDALPPFRVEANNGTNGNGHANGAPRGPLPTQNGAANSFGGNSANGFVLTSNGANGHVPAPPAHNDETAPAPRPGEPAAPPRRP